MKWHVTYHCQAAKDHDKTKNALRCKFNWNHVFFDRKELLKHQNICVDANCIEIDLTEEISTADVQSIEENDGEIMMAENLEGQIEEDKISWCDLE